MSSHYHEEINCPKCKQPFEITIWKSINVDLDPAEKDKIKNGTFNAAVCPHCGYKSSLAYACLYHDMANHMQIYVLPENFEHELKEVNSFLDKTPDGLGDLAISKMKEEYSLRDVHNFQELREKVIILDAGFDDRIIELVKLMYHEAMTKNRENIQAIFFDAEDDKQYFIIFLDDGTFAPVELDQDLYHQFAERFQSMLNDFTSKDEFNVIDEQWAKAFLGL